MDEITLVTNLFHDLYNVDTITLSQLSESSLQGGYLIYRVQYSNNASWVARVYRRNRAIPDWFRYFYPWLKNDMLDWLSTRAATLAYLEQQAYDAPRIIRTLANTLVGATDEWCMLVTTFVEGTTLEPTPTQLRQLGATLGHLHTLPFPDIAAIGPSYWDIRYALSSALALLASIEHLIPVEFFSMHTAYRQTFEHIQAHSNLSPSIIHGDMWAANAVQTEGDRIIPIDWDSSGSGLAVLDLGRLLLECHLDSDLSPDVPSVWLIQPDMARIHSVVDGYCQHRFLSSTELDILLNALRFTIAFIGTLHLSQVLQTEPPDQVWIDGMNRRWTRLQNRWDVSIKIADIARERFSYHNNSDKVI